MDYLKAFLVGGAICMLGQLLIDKTRLTPARILVCYVVLGVIGVLVFHFDGNLMPRSSMVVGFLFSFVSTVTIRFSYRLLRTAQRRISHITHANGVKNVMLIGAGDAGRALAVEFTNSDHIQDHLSLSLIHI